MLYQDVSLKNIQGTRIRKFSFTEDPILMKKCMKSIRRKEILKSVVVCQFDFFFQCVILKNEKSLYGNNAQSSQLRASKLQAYVEKA